MAEIQPSIERDSSKCINKSQLKILTKIGPDQSHNNCGRLGIAPLALTLQEGCPRGTYADIIEEAYTKPVGKAPGAAIDDMQAAESERPNEAY